MHCSARTWDGASCWHMFVCMCYVAFGSVRMHCLCQDVLWEGVAEGGVIRVGMVSGGELLLNALQ